MAQIIESIPNISEGRNQEVIEACVDQIRTTPGCSLLNYSSSLQMHQYCLLHLRSRLRVFLP